MKIPSNSIIFSLASLDWFSNRRNVSWWRQAQIKQLAWPIAEQQIGQQKLSLVFSTRFPVVKWRSQWVAKTAYYTKLYIYALTDQCELHTLSIELRTEPGFCSFIHLF